jgi:sulfonate transport system substrate-binding protein
VARGYDTWPPSNRTATIRRSSFPRTRRSRRSPTSKASVSPSARDRALNLLVAALEKAGLSYGDISPAPLAPADATAAFLKGSVDAWSIWDPYLALAELKENARVIAFDKDVHKPNAFYIARSDFVDKHPALVAKLNVVFASEGLWADSHHDEVAKAQAEATGVDIDAVKRFVARSSYRVVPVDDESLIPKPVNVSDVIWKWSPGS